MLVVVAAAILRADGRFLLQRRPLGKEHGGLWEFPGGKIEAGESAKDALVRELKEELGLIIQPDDLQAATFATPENAPGPANPAIVILLYTCRTWQGAPCALDGQEIGWFASSAFADLAMPPLDIPLRNWLRESI
jgi:8-oxo-dGTP diphosphatase